MPITTLSNEDEKEKRLPIAFGKPTPHEPVVSSELTELLKPFISASTAQCYFGPSGIGEDLVPWLIVITQDNTRPRRYRDAGQMSLLGWRWNVTPACPFSLTLMGLKDSRPHARWMDTSEGSVVQAFGGRMGLVIRKSKVRIRDESE